MESALKAYALCLNVLFDAGFNPSFNGIGSESQKIFAIKQIISSFNPSFNGIGSERKFVSS